MKKKLQRLQSSLRATTFSFWYGFGSAMDIGGSYFRPVYDPHDGHPSTTDALSLRKDWAMVSNDLRRVVAE